MLQTTERRDDEPSNDVHGVGAAFGTEAIASIPAAIERLVLQRNSAERDLNDLRAAALELRLDKLKRAKSKAAQWEEGGDDEAKTVQVSPPVACCRLSPVAYLP